MIIKQEMPKVLSFQACKALAKEIVKQKPAFHKGKETLDWWAQSLIDAGRLNLN